MNSPVLASIIPCFAVADVGATMRWYAVQLGFRVQAVPEREPYLFAIMVRDGIEIMLQRIEAYEKPEIYEQREGGVWNAYIRAEGVKDLYELVRHRVTIVKPLRRQPYGCWEFEVKDLNGYVLVFSEEA